MKLDMVLPAIEKGTDPRQILEALDDAGREMSFSNYHNRLFDYAEAIVRAYCREHQITIGPTKETRDRKLRKEQARVTEDPEASAKVLAYIKRLSEPAISNPRRGRGRSSRGRS